MPGWLVASEGSLTIALDVELTDRLRREGVARELINRIQNLRKDSGFDVTDRIITDIYTDLSSVRESLDEFGEYVGAQTLSTEVRVHALTDAPSSAKEVEWEGGAVRINVEK